MVSEYKLNSFRPRLGLYEHSSHTVAAVNMKYQSWWLTVHRSITLVDLQLDAQSSRLAMLNKQDRYTNI